MEASDQLISLNKNSHKEFKVKCDLCTSIKCRSEYSMEYRRYLKILKENNDKIVCIYCSRTTKFSGRNNPNTKYLSIDDNFFTEIDSNDKAYLLGWIASDGHIGTRGFKISIHQKDIDTLINLKNIICKEIPIKKFKTQTSSMCSFEINSKQISKDLCSLLKINPGAKSCTVNFPILKTDDLQWCFIRGYFDGDGSINDCNKSKFSYPKGNIRSNSEDMLNGIRKFSNLNGKITCNMISMSNNILLNFLKKMYSASGFKLERKFQRYIGWKNNA